jgi:DNA mismatch repair protein MutS
MNQNLETKITVKCPQILLSAEGATPVITQYLEIKNDYPHALLFFRMGDFYELFFDDAVIAARELSLTLTRRGKHMDQDIPLAGVPHHAAETYIARLLRSGYKIAVCEQLEDPAEAKKRGHKAVVRRGVVRVVTPGTVTEDPLLEPKTTNLLIAITEHRDEWALAGLDLSSGDFFVESLQRHEITNRLAIYAPSESLMSPRLFENYADVNEAIGHYGGLYTPMGPASEDLNSAKRKLITLYEVASLDAFGAFRDAHIRALGQIAHYIETTQSGLKPSLRAPRLIRSEDGLMIDAATRHSLEISQTQKGTRKGSLLDCLDLTNTACGARLMAQRLAAPLTNPKQINQRLDDVAWLIGQKDILVTISALFRNFSDPLRALGRLGLKRGSPRDLISLAQAIEVGEQIARILDQAFGMHNPNGLGTILTLPSGLIDIIKALKPSSKLAELKEKLLTAIAPDATGPLRDGGFINRGIDEALDAHICLRDDSRRILVGLETRLSEESAVPLKIRHNGMLGYFFEVTLKQNESLKSWSGFVDFRLKQSLSNVVRYTNQALSDLDHAIARAGQLTLSRELEIFDELVSFTVEQRVELEVLTDAIAALDVGIAAATWALDNRAVRPTIDESSHFEVRAGRHAVVSWSRQQKGESFTPNDLELDQTGHKHPRLQLVTGPNMAGKSTYLRQNALFIIMAQAGFFVPAQSMHLGVVDRLFSRIGAGDDLAQGRSTFMMEMVETAAIISQASDRSFVIFDELGRGTATYDGMAIAHACVEYLHNDIKCRALFATHYHELAGLEKSLTAMGNLSLSAREHKGELVFLHHIVKGAADRSFGVSVAKLAGLPPILIKRARQILGELETQKDDTLSASLNGELPLFFNHYGLNGPDYTQLVSQNHLNNHPILEELNSLNLEGLTPFQALTRLYEWKEVLNSSSDKGREKAKDAQ